jgi:hypothetical protein
MISKFWPRRSLHPQYLVSEAVQFLANALMRRQA